MKIISTAITVIAVTMAFVACHSDPGTDIRNAEQVQHNREAAKSDMDSQENALSTFGIALTDAGHTYSLDRISKLAEPDLSTVLTSLTSYVRSADTYLGSDDDDKSKDSWPLDNEDSYREGRANARQLIAAVQTRQNELLAPPAPASNKSK